jgi:hypothetical protein
MDALSPDAAVDMILDYPAAGPADGAFYTEAAPSGISNSDLNQAGFVPAPGRAIRRANRLLGVTLWSYDKRANGDFSGSTINVSRLRF